MGHSRKRSARVFVALLMSIIACATVFAVAPVAGADPPAPGDTTLEVHLTIGTQSAEGVQVGVCTDPTVESDCLFEDVVDDGLGTATATFGSLAVGTYTIGVRATWLSDPLARDFSTYEIGSVPLESGPNEINDTPPVGGRLQGTVTDSDGAPTTGGALFFNSTSPPPSPFPYSVFAPWLGLQPATIASDGTFITHALPADTYFVDVSPLGPFHGAAVRLSQTIGAGATTPFTPQFAPGGQISGRVTAGGAPVAFASVSVFSPFGGDGASASGSTDEHGDYLIGDVVPGSSYSLIVSAPGYSTQQVDGLSVAADTTTTGVDFALAEGFTISGVVRDASNNPIEGASISAQLGSSSVIAGAETDASGSYELVDVAAGTWNLTVQKAGYIGATQFNVPISGSTTLNFVLQQTGSITGVVSDVNGDPVVGATVFTIGGTSFPVTSGVGGTYTLPGLAPGPYTVTAQPPFGSSAGLAVSAPATVTGGLTTTLNLQLQRPGKLSVVVKDTSGNRVPGASVGASPTTFFGPTVAGPADANGFVGFPTLAPGTYTVTANGYNGPTSVPGVVVTGGATTSIEVIVPAGSGIFGRATRNTATSYSFNFVYACAFPESPINGTLCPGTTGTLISLGLNGTYVRGLPPGTYNVAEVHTNGIGVLQASSPMVTVTLAPGQMLACSFHTDDDASAAFAACDGDGDGVGEPAGYSGNGDVVPDDEQSNVTSLAPTVGSVGDMLTLASPTGTTITNVGVLNPAGSPVPMPHGLIDFTVHGVTPLSTISVDLYVPGPTPPMGYWKYRALGTPQWVDASSLIDSITPASDNRYKVTLELTDNGAGDDDPAPGVIHDPAGVTDVVLDQTGPEITCPSPRPRFVLNQSGTTLQATATDAESGPLTQTVTVNAPTDAIGIRSVGVTASDNAGNPTTTSCEYEVGYQFAGFSSPVDNLPTVNSAKAGQTIPIKWRITDANGVGIADPASFVELTTNGGTACGSDVDTIETYSTSSGLEYLGNGYWQFNWKTPKGYAGTCRRMKLNLADGSGGHVADFQFK